MTSRPRTGQSRAHRGARRLVGLTIALTAFGCATSDGKRARPVIAADATGFSITESTRIGLRTRSEFDKANRAFEAGDRDRGIEILQEIAESSPGLAAVHINLGIAHRQAEDFEAAETSLRTAVETSPRHPVAHNELGLVYRRTGQFALARASFEKALALQPEFHFARKNLAILCDLFVSDLRCALENYELYQSAVPDDESAEIWIADLRNRIGE